jgi:hypothetical protein
MKRTFTPQQISKVIDQSLIYQCACPAQVSSTIIGLRDLYDYQMNCARDTANDRAVHETIARATEQAHEVMESCLGEVLTIEGWDPVLLEMPPGLRKKTTRPL